MRTLDEINDEFKGACAQIGHAYAQKRALMSRIESLLARIQELENEAAARRLVDTEKAKDAKKETDKSVDPDLSGA